MRHILIAILVGVITGIITAVIGYLLVELHLVTVGNFVRSIAVLVGVVAAIYYYLTNRSVL